jgi:Domain of unknown function (DUF5666)
MNARPGGLILFGFLASLSLVSCGGSGSDPSAGGGIGGTGYVSSGTITGFGSIVVNGVEFDTGNALVIIGGRPAGSGNQAVLGNLDLGQVVVIEATVNQTVSPGSASRVMFTPNVKGPAAEIISIDPTIKKVIVLGQTIIIDETTVLRDTSLEALAVNNFVEVSGLMDATGVIQATYVKKKADSFAPLTEVEVKGFVQDLDSTAKTFRLSDLAVYYGQADIGRLAGSSPAANQLVHVRGTIGPEWRLEATKVEPADESRMASAERLDLEGFITEFISSSDFRMGSEKVQADGNTQFVGGGSEDLELGARIRVRGRMVNGILVAQQVFFCDQIQLESRISSKDSGSRALLLSGLETITVTVTSLTKIVGGTKDFENIHEGDHLKVRGRGRAGGSVVATRLQVIPSPHDPEAVVLQGPVKTISKPTLVILGVTVDTSVIPDNSFEGVTGPDKRTEFFQKIQSSDLVKARGRIGMTNQVTWEGISLEKGS